MFPNFLLVFFKACNSSCDKTSHKYCSSYRERERECLPLFSAMTSRRFLTSQQRQKENFLRVPTGRVELSLKTSPPPVYRRKVKGEKRNKSLLKCLLPHQSNGFGNARSQRSFTETESIVENRKNRDEWPGKRFIFFADIFSL